MSTITFTEGLPLTNSLFQIELIPCWISQFTFCPCRIRTDMPSHLHLLLQCFSHFHRYHWLATYVPRPFVPQSRSTEPVLNHWQWANLMLSTTTHLLVHTQSVHAPSRVIETPFRIGIVQSYLSSPLNINYGGCLLKILKENAAWP